MPYEAPLLGLLLSLAFIALTGLHPGGVIVPSYLVLFLDQPLRLAATLVAALLTLGCYRLAERHLILYGTRRFVFMILVAASWTLLGQRVLPSAAAPSLEFQVIGWIIPGLIANTCERQGVLLTAASLVTVTIAAHFAGLMLGAAMAVFSR